MYRAYTNLSRLQYLGHLFEKIACRIAAKPIICKDQRPDVWQIWQVKQPCRCFSACACSRIMRRAMFKVFKPESVGDVEMEELGLTWQVHAEQLDSAG